MDAYQNYWMLDFKEAIKVEKQLLNQRNPYSHIQNIACYLKNKLNIMICLTKNEPELGSAQRSALLRWAMGLLCFLLPFVKG